ncbi:hypothetical protein GCM10028803_03670 [Larkinella knui]|uniref:hypothetical protein n=1 Tax=Larkinella knui TaxID=2025310 RepID=UPI001639D50C|nr:hypothetical protein [Larkinella knui]
MFLFLGLTTSGLIFYIFLLMLSGMLYLYSLVKRLFGPESDYLSDDSDGGWDSDSDGDD